MIGKKLMKGIDGVPGTKLPRYIRGIRFFAWSLRTSKGRETTRCPKCEDRLLRHSLYEDLTNYIREIMMHWLHSIYIMFRSCVTFKWHTYIHSIDQSKYVMNSKFNIINAKLSHIYIHTYMFRFNHASENIVYWIG